MQTGDVLADAELDDSSCRSSTFPEPVMSFAVTPKTKGDEDKVAQALRRLHEEDPTLQLRRDPQTGESAALRHEPGARRGRRRAG